MKKFLLSAIITLAIFAGYGQTKVDPQTGISFTLDQPHEPDENYDYTASEFVKLTGDFSYDPYSDETFHAVTDPLMVFPPMEGETGGPPNNNDGGVVGTIPGKASVGSNGSANYQIPIKVLSGINGMAPKISLAYNSNAGNGIMGIRWNVAGLSAIQRTGTTIYHEGFVDGVDFDNNDKLMLNGNRLIPVGANEYRTEIETFSKIVAMNVSNGWPQWFKVYTKSGYIYEYGNTENSRIEAPERDDVISWKVNKISDRKGNYIDFQYIEEHGMARISGIDYADDSSGVINSIDFYYSEERIDDIQYYLSGSEFKLNALLDSIQVNYLPTQTTVRTYVMNYDATGLNSRLSDITLWDEGRVQHFNPTSFTWGEESIKFDQESTNITNESEADIVTGDFNGDGKTDVAAAFYNLTSGAQQEKEYSTWSVYYSNSPDGTSFQKEDFGNLPGDFSHFVVIDFNGDGLQDLVRIQDFEYYYMKSNGLGFSDPLHGGNHIGNIENHCEFAPVDLNGNGIGDLLLISKSGTKTTYNYRIDAFEFNGSQFVSMLGNQGFVWSNASDDLEVLPGDFNGDGKTEILIETQINTCTIYSLDATNSALENEYVDDFNIPISSIGVKTLTGDINGDGITDLVTVSNDDPPVLTVRLLNGKDNWIDLDANITFPASNQLEKYDSYYNYIVSDFNGDNKSDILLGYSKFIRKHASEPWQFEGRHWDLYYSNGTNLSVDKNSIGGLAFHPYTFDIRYAHCDFNGDGKNDNFIFDGGFSGNKSIIFFHKNEQVNLIQKITNGLGTETKFSYEPLTNNEIYTKGDINIDRVKNIQNTLHVVDAIWQDDGLGGWFKQAYKYTGATYHLEGKGFLGFSNIWQKDLSSGLTISRQSYLNPYYFIPYVYYIQKTSTTPSRLLSEQQIRYEVYDYGNKRIFAYPDFNQTNIFRTGDEGNDYVKTIRKICHYSSVDINYGNITSDTVLVDESDIHFVGPVSQFDYYTINNYNYNYEGINDWLISRPEQQTVTKKSPDDDQEYYQQYNYTYYKPYKPQYPLLKTFSYIPNNFDQFRVDTDFDYDDYGNIKSETISAPNYTPSIEDRTTEYDYSAEYNYRFLTQTTKAVNDIDFIQTNQYYETTGLTESTMDINNQTTSYAYDGFGRLVKTVQPNGVETHSVLRWNVFPDPGQTVYYQWQKTSGTPEVFLFLDKLGRHHKTWANNFNDQTVIADKYYYTEGNIAHGKLYRETEPYFANDTPLENEYQYISTGRLKKLIGPAATIKFTYNGRTTVTENTTTGQSSSQTVNATGQLRLAEDPCGTVEYHYKSSGQPFAIEKNSGGLQSAIEIFYDDAGFKDSLIDPDAGTFLFDYNPYGELVSQINARGFTYQMQYDALGRLTEKKLVDPMQITTYSYDGENALGLISSVTGHNGISQSYQYNSNVQLICKTETIEGHDYAFNYDFDVFGRVKEESWPTGFTVNYKYRNGYLGKVVDKESGKVLWELNDVDARNQILEFALGNNLTTTHGYDDFGFPTSITTSNNIQDLSYGFDQETGNLNWRKDKTDPGNILEEVFGYDDKLKSRLTSWIVTNGDSHGIDYLDNGNIDLKTDVGNYNYDTLGLTGRPHALKKIQNPKEGYLQHGPTQNVTYTPFDKVDQISHPTDLRRLSFTYGPGNMRKITRLYQTDDAGGDILLQTKTFIGGNYEIEEDAEGNQRKLHYLSASSGLFAIFVKDNEGEHMYYIHKDYLGSFQSVTNEEGEIVEKYAFDPWGRRRNPNNWSFTDVPENFLFDRGYTGHEHLDDFGLINMNGRVYDPFVARFLSPDPFVSNPVSTQGFNRYTYVTNNPFIYTDPFGYTNHPISAQANITINYAAYGILNEISGPIGPQQGNHWSNEYNSFGEVGDFLFMSPKGFDKMYGDGANQVGRHLYSNDRSRDLWRHSEISVAEILEYGGVYWDPISGEEVGRESFTTGNASYTNIYYTGDWVLVALPQKIVTTNGGINELGFTKGGALIVTTGGEKYHFMENGILHWQDNTIANYKYYIENKEMFTDSKGNLVRFGDVFKSQKQIYSDILSITLMDVFAVDGKVIDYMINVKWRSPYAPLIPGYVAPKDITTPYEIYRFISPSESP